MSLEEISFQIILYAGNARSFSMEGIALAREKKFEEARKKIEDAESAFVEAHHFQTELLQTEANGEPITPSVLLVHAQDHLMTSMTVKELAAEIIFLHESK
ncbi:PTS lactose/cellobiose transporter subunit IIA [Salisediminibacterium beveridgei]|nr:PTS lactose/cellobiose transporter subunit IIA [Salisediminibacterium beveridgei]